jgi:hypothetical protein
MWRIVVREGPTQACYTYRYRFGFNGKELFFWADRLAGPHSSNQALAGCDMSSGTVRVDKVGSAVGLEM